MNFLYEDEISEDIGKICEEGLVGSGESRSLYAMNIIPESLTYDESNFGKGGKRDFSFLGADDKGSNKKVRLDTPTTTWSMDLGGSKEPQQKEKIRNDPNQRKLTEFNFKPKTSITKKLKTTEIFESPVSKFIDLDEGVSTQDAGTRFLETNKFELDFSTPKLFEFDLLKKNSENFRPGTTKTDGNFVKNSQISINFEECQLDLRLVDYGI